MKRDCGKKFYVSSLSRRVKPKKSERGNARQRFLLALLASSTPTPSPENGFLNQYHHHLIEKFAQVVVAQKRCRAAEVARIRSMGPSRSMIVALASFRNCIQLISFVCVGSFVGGAFSRSSNIRLFGLFVMSGGGVEIHLIIDQCE